MFSNCHEELGAGKGVDFHRLWLRKAILQEKLRLDREAAKEAQAARARVEAEEGLVSDEDSEGLKIEARQLGELFRSFLHLRHGFTWFYMVL